MYYLAILVTIFFFEVKVEEKSKREIKIFSLPLLSPPPTYVGGGDLEGGGK